MFHTEIDDRWKKLSIFEQMANIGAEVGRVNSWKKKGNEQMYLNAFYRAMELMDLTIAAHAKENLVKELTRTKEVLCDYVVGDNVYKTTDEGIEKYFFYFNLAVRKDR